MANPISKIFGSNNFLSLANNGLVAVFGFLSFILLVRQLPQDVFGEWILFITMGNFIDMLRFGITRTALIRFLSGANKDEAKELMGSNNTINLVSTVLLVGLILLAYNLYSESIASSGFEMFFIWYPILAFLNLSFNNAQSVLQAKMRFDTMLWLRAINVGGFMLFLFINVFMRYDINTIILVYLGTNLLSSIIASVYNWDGIRYMVNTSKSSIRIILDFGKYTTGTLIGSNLLKSSDTFIIGLSPFLGTTAVALYSIPLKLTEIIEIPLRSFAATAFPGMSKASIEKNIPLVKHIFYENAGGMTFLLMPLMLICFIFAEQAVLILGGPEYLETANIFRIFCIYGLILPIDRFIGVALDSVNRPKQNFFKVVYMTMSNILGDLLVVFGISYLIAFISVTVFFMNTQASTDGIIQMASNFTIIKTLEMVAIITILFTIIGILVGYHYLRKEMDLHIRSIFTVGFKSIKRMTLSIIKL